VMGLWTMALPGLNPVTGLLVGAVAQLAGPRAGFALAGVTLGVAALAGWRALSDDAAPIVRHLAVSDTSQLEA
jgi:hypothetical protein